MDGKTLEEFILGWQDGVVNVLGIIIGVAVATNETKIILIAGLAALFAESISMGAVAYTSKKANLHYYFLKKKEEKEKIKKHPEEAKKELTEVFKEQGFAGKNLKDLVRIIFSNKNALLGILLKEKHNLEKQGKDDLKKATLLVGFATVFGSIIPLISFFFMPVKDGLILSLVLSGVSLFIVGWQKGRITKSSLTKSALEMLAIGMAAAIVGYFIGTGLELLL